MKVLLFLILLSTAITGAQLNPRDLGSSSLHLQLSWTVSNQGNSGKQGAITVFAFPSNSHQTVNYSSSDPFTEQTDASGNKLLSYSLNLNPGESRQVILYANARVSFGEYESAVGDYSAYTKPSQFVTISNNVKKKALGITVNAEDDGERIALLAEWVHNYVKYDENCAGGSLEECVKKSFSDEWVLENRVGVCDEYSHLLIGMLRSLNIPARFVAGIVYSGKDWAPHAWVEALIKGRWVPLDPTYGEAGMLDAGHLQFALGRDNSDISESYTEGLSITSNPPEVYLLDYSSFPDFFGLSASVDNRTVGPLSIHNFSVTVRNKVNETVFIPLYLDVPKIPPGLAVNITRGYEDRVEYLPPGEEKEVSWSLLFPKAMEDNYVYNFTLTASSLSKEASESVEGRKDYSSGKVSGVAVIDVHGIQSGNSLTVQATVKNQGNSLEDASVLSSFEGVNQTASITLNAGEEKTVGFQYPPSAEEFERGRIIVSAGGEEVTQEFILYLNKETTLLPPLPVVLSSSIDTTLLAEIGLGVLLLVFIVVILRMKQ